VVTGSGYKKADYVEEEEVELTWVQKQALAYKESLGDGQRANIYKPVAFRDSKQAPVGHKWGQC